MEFLTSLITALGAVAIPVALFILSSKQNKKRDDLAKKNDRKRAELAKTYGTLRELSAFNQYFIGEVLAKIHFVKRDSENIKDKRLKNLTYEEIVNNIELKLLIEQILNQVDYLCIGVDKDVLRGDLINKVLNDRIKYIWDTFQNFIAGRRKEEEKKWSAIESFLKR